MRKALITLNALVASASAVLLGYTLVARDHLVGLAEDFAVVKTVEYATEAVDRVEAALRLPAVAAVTPAAVRDALKAEIGRFRQDRRGYVRALVARGAADELPEHLLGERMAGWKDEIRNHFATMLAELVRDLRIFSGTNFVAALLAMWLAVRARGRWRYHILGMSVLLGLALGLHIYVFVDNLTVFRILWNTRVGWSYPVLVTGTFVYLYLAIGSDIPPVPPGPSGPDGPAAVR